MARWKVSRSQQAVYLVRLREKVGSSATLNRESDVLGGLRTARQRPQQLNTRRVTTARPEQYRVGLAAINPDVVNPCCVVPCCALLPPQILVW